MREKRILITAALAAMSVTAALGAQSAKAMPGPASGDAMSATYTGCVASVNHGARFLLTKVDSQDATHGDMAMKHQDGTAVKHNDPAMKSDAAKTMQHEQTRVAGEKMDAMSSKSFVLVGTTNFNKYVGRKVSATGSLADGSMGTTREDQSTLTVKRLKVIAKSCS